jgi:hypothetical protein
MMTKTGSRLQVDLSANFLFDKLPLAAAIAGVLH